MDAGGDGGRSVEKAKEEEKEGNMVTARTNRVDRKRWSLVIPYIRGFLEMLRRVVGG